MSVDGEQQLPGATDQLLRATNAKRAKERRRMADYHGLSVVRLRDGRWQAMSVRLDPATGQVVPTLLDRWDQPESHAMSPAEALLYWAQQAVLDERGVLE